MNGSNRLLKIWVVEDDSDDQVLIQEAFENLRIPVDVLFVSDGQKLLDKVSYISEAEKPDLIVIDLRMPKVDGLEALSQIRKNDIFNSVEIAVLTASDSPATQICCKKSGADYFFTKPNSFDELLETVKSMVGSLMQQ